MSWLNTLPHYDTPENWGKRRTKAEFKFLCVYCGTNAKQNNPVEVHHVVYRSERPDLAALQWNMVTLCSEHHKAIHQRKNRVVEQAVIELSIKRICRDFDIAAPLYSKKNLIQLLVALQKKICTLTYKECMTIIRVNPEVDYCIYGEHKLTDDECGRSHVGKAHKVAHALRGCCGSEF